MERSTTLLKEQDKQIAKLERQLLKQAKALAGLTEELRAKTVLLEDSKAECEYMESVISREVNGAAFVSQYNNIDLEAIRFLQIVVIGGREDWQARLRDKYPNFSFVGVKEANYNVNVLDKADVIVFNWTYAGVQQAKGIFAEK